MMWSAFTKSVLAFELGTHKTSNFAILILDVNNVVCKVVKYLEVEIKIFGG